MANLNILDKFWLDIMDVAIAMGSKDQAIGNAIRFFRYAQEVHKKGFLITEKEFQAQGFSEALIPLFAERVEGGIQAVGANKHFGWLMDKAEAGSAGGRVSAQRPRDEKGRLLPKPQANVQATSSETQASPSSPSEAKHESSTAKVVQPIPIHIPSPILNPNCSSSSLDSQTAASAILNSDGEMGAIPELADGIGLAPVLAKVQRSVQQSWLVYWPDVQWVKAVAEKAVMKTLASGRDPQTSWSIIITSWLWRENNPPKRKKVNPAAAKTTEIEMHDPADYTAEEAEYAKILKAEGVTNYSDLIGAVKRSVHAV